MNDAGDAVMMDALRGRARAELRSIYSASTPQQAAHISNPPAPAEDWERWRKYAYVMYWGSRMDDATPISDEEVGEWSSFLGVSAFHNVACGVIGDAARRNLLSEETLRGLRNSSSLTPYAARQVEARLALMELPLGHAVLNQLLDLRAGWAVRELLVRELTRDQLELIQSCLQDHRLSRVERHRLRDALRARPR